VDRRATYLTHDHKRGLTLDCLPKADAHAVFVQRGRNRIGAKSRAFAADGQVSAGNEIGNNDRLVIKIVHCTVLRPCGSTLPAPHKHLLFRTPSFRGQADVCDTDLSAFFFLTLAGPARRKPAQDLLRSSLILNNKAGFGQLQGSSSRNQKGQIECELHELFLRWRRASASPPAVTQPENRRSWAVASEPSERRSSARTRSLGLRSARRAMCCTAKPRTTVTDTGIAGRTASRPSIDGTPLRGISPAAAFSFAQNTKTEDVPCSTRS